MPMLNPFVFAGAGLLDEVLGDPEGWPHPVRAFGWVIACIDQARLRIRSAFGLRILGVCLALGLPLVAAAFAVGVVRLCGHWAWLAELVLGAWMLAGRSLRTAVRSVAESLEAADLPRARQAVAQVVGRDTAELDEDGVVRAALETLAESLCDGVVAPLFWFALGGLPALWAFKAVSTLDSMVGHREAPWTYFGWASARLDDLMNLVPARICALLIAGAAGSMSALRLAWRDGSRTVSPNAGWVEAAFAGALGVELGGTNAYDGVAKEGPRLGEVRRPRDLPVLREGLELTGRVNRVAIVLGTVLMGVIHVL
jgi:adenosylcobinamide-phosphate synthase